MLTDVDIRNLPEMLKKMMKSEVIKIAKAIDI
jgi:hypothetical protein